MLLHGLTATRRYVVTARGRSSAAATTWPPTTPAGTAFRAGDKRYDYDVLSDDLLAVLDGLGIEPRCSPARRWGRTRSRRSRCATPTASRGRPHHAGLRPRGRARPSWDARAAGLRDGGIDGFVEASKPFSSPERWTT